VLLALESVTVVAVRAAEIQDARQGAVAGVPAATRIVVAGHPTTRRAAAVGPDVASDTLLSRTAELERATTAREVESAPVPKPRPDIPAAAPSKAVTTRNPTRAPASGGARATAFHGRNHVWSPALGIDKRVYRFPCSRAEEPGNVVYRWGCAGRNNVYLMGHAANVFAGLNRAYYTGKLRPGLKVYYADSAGIVRTYEVRWWKVVYPTPDVDWAWASLPRPSMTLQTCIGKHSEQRLMVRLVQVSG
jgi:hypothetical protein